METGPCPGWLISTRAETLWTRQRGPSSSSQTSLCGRTAAETAVDVVSSTMADEGASDAANADFVASGDSLDEIKIKQTEAKTRLNLTSPSLRGGMFERVGP